MQSWSKKERVRESDFSFDRCTSRTVGVYHVCMHACKYACIYVWGGGGISGEGGVAWMGGFKGKPKVLKDSIREFAKGLG
jgi:hypothetical protein